MRLSRKTMTVQLLMSTQLGAAVEAWCIPTKAIIYATCDECKKRKKGFEYCRAKGHACCSKKEEEAHKNV